MGTRDVGNPMTAQLPSGGRGARPRQPLGRGALQVLLAESLVVPAGIITAAYLGRVLGPLEYGILAAALAVGDTLEWLLTAAFSRATIQVVSETDDWTRIAASTFRLKTGIGVALGALLWLTAGPIAGVLDAEIIAPSLRLLAFEIPLMAAGTACRNILTGRGQYRERAVASAIRWVSRRALIVILVQAGLGLYGAVLAKVLASLIWLITGFTFARVPVTAPGLPHGNTRLWRLVLPLFVMALSLRVLDKVGLLAVKSLGGSAAEAGWYAAAQNFALVPNLIAISFSPLLLGALTAAVRGGDLAAGRPLVRNGLRLALGLVPFAAFGAGAAPEIVNLIYGRGFEPAARLAIPLLGAAIGMTIVSLTAAMLAAADQAASATRLAWPVTLGAIIALWIVVPLYGAMGAAIVSGASALAGAAIMLAAVRRCWKVGPPIETCLRVFAVSALTLAAALTWPAYGGWLVLKALVGVVGIVASLAALGEFSRDDIRLALSLVQTSRSAG
jgi:O-antigen/teichoic acid export membrane protein